MKRTGKAVVLAMLFAAVSASAAVKTNLIRIKVLDSETHSVLIDDSGVPKNCDQVNFDAYCHNSRSTQVTNTVLVQEGDKPPYRITCTVDMKFSRCIALPRGASFDAKREKRGLTVYYADDSGKMRKQLYVLVAQESSKEDERNQQEGASVPVSTTGEAVAGSSASPSPAASPAPAPKSASAPSESPTPAQSPGPAQTPASVTSNSQAVRCSFSSTPVGAEITLDGKYVGSTPSTVNVAPGAHAVVISMPGFAQWKRDLTVTTGSELTVNAVLEKQ